MIEINDISVTYRSGDSEIPALSSLSLSVNDGDYLSILGPNGSGKSTLVKAICGLAPFSGGEIIVDDQKIERGDFSNKLFGKIGVVFQEPSGQFLMPTVKKEIESPLQNLGLDYSEQQRIFDRITEKFNLIDLLNLSPEKLSPGQMQIVNLAVAFSIGSVILILDEPTTFLDLKFRKIFLDFVQEMNNEGRSIIHITQYPDEALLSKNTAIIDDGRVVTSGDPLEILSDEEILNRCGLSAPRKMKFRKVFGFDIDNLDSAANFISTIKLHRILDSTANSDISPVISTHNLNFSYSDSDFSLDIDKIHLYENQITGLVGPSGSGKSTLALLLSGVMESENSEIRYFNEAVSDYSEYRKKIGISWQMPDPVLIGPTVKDDLRLGYEDRDFEEDDYSAILGRVGLAGSENRIVDTLSGGEKRKLSLASVLVGRPEYLILDEPAAFLDPISQLELKRTIKSILPGTKGALIISHDLMFLSDLVDRIIGLKDGRIAFDLPAAKFFSDPEYCRAIGLDIDMMINFRSKMIRSGIELLSNSLDPAVIRKQLDA